MVISIVCEYATKRKKKNTTTTKQNPKRIEISCFLRFFLRFFFRFLKKRERKKNHDPVNTIISIDFLMAGVEELRKIRKEIRYKTQSHTHTYKAEYWQKDFFPFCCLQEKEMF